MLTFSLQSGSNGNSIYVEADGVRLLFDAGLSGRQAEQRMGAHGRDIRRVDALLISHNHADHVRGAGVFQRKFKLPVYMTRPTHQSAAAYLGPMPEVRYFRAGDRLQFGGVSVHTVPTPHDAADGVAFVVEHAGRRLGILTDLGHPFRGLRALLATLDGLYLESNYDPQMLADGPYPWPLQQRIRGRGGHLSNHEAAELIRSAGRRLQWAALAHLSEQNNDPDLALATHRRRVGRRLPLYIAPRYAAGAVLTI